MQSKSSRYDLQKQYERWVSSLMRLWVVNFVFIAQVFWENSSMVMFYVCFMSVSDFARSPFFIFFSFLMSVKYICFKYVMFSSLITDIMIFWYQNYYILNLTFMNIVSSSVLNARLVPAIEMFKHKPWPT